MSVVPIQGLAPLATDCRPSGAERPRYGCSDMGARAGLARTAAMMTGRGREAWERMTPEQRAAVEALRAQNRTPEAQAENERIAAAARAAHPPIEVDESLAQFVAGLRLERERAGL